MIENIIRCAFALFLLVIVMREFAKLVKKIVSYIPDQSPIIKFIRRK